MNSWKKLKSKKVYCDPWIRVRVDDVIRPDGNLGNYAVVELKGGIGVVMVNSSKEICLVGQYRYAPNVYSWEIPKGAFETFESKKNPLNTAKRELSEETGFSAKSWHFMGKVHTLMGSTDDLVHLFFAHDIVEGIPNPEAVEDIVVNWVTSQNFKSMVKAGEISDATSIAALYLAESYF